MEQNKDKSTRNGQQKYLQQISEKVLIKFDFVGTEPGPDYKGFCIKKTEVNGSICSLLKRQLTQ